jgi:hypothetical protein
MPLNFKFPENREKSISSGYSSSNSKETAKSSQKQKSSKNKNKAKNQLINNKIQTTSSTNSDYLYEFTTTMPNKYTLERFSSNDHQITVNNQQHKLNPELTTTNPNNLISNSMPSIYFGKVLFNENNLLLPLANKERPKDTGKFILKKFDLTLRENNIFILVFLKNHRIRF